jgi:hypothetical protein
MKLWTYHPGGFDLLTPGLVLDASRGQYMHDTRNGLRFASVLPRLVQRLNTNQFLWCNTERGWTVTEENYGTKEWELTVDPAKALVFINAWHWERIVYGTSDDWNPLFVGIPDGPDRGVHALVPFPVSPDQILCNDVVPLTPRTPIHR